MSKPPEYCEQRVGKRKFKCCNCGVIFTIQPDQTDNRFCPDCAGILAAKDAIIKTESALQRASNTLIDKLGKVNNARSLGASTISTNASLQAAGKKIAKILNKDTPEEALGEIISEITNRALGLDQPKGPGLTPGFKPHLQLQAVQMLMTMVNQVETLQAAKTLDLSNLEEEDLKILLRPVAVELLKNDTAFLLDCLKAAKLQVMTEDGDLLGCESPILEVEAEYAGTAEAAEQYARGDGPEGGLGVDAEEAGWSETLPPD